MPALPPSRQCRSARRSSAPPTMLQVRAQCAESACCSAFCATPADCNTTYRPPKSRMSWPDAYDAGSISSAFAFKGETVQNAVTTSVAVGTRIAPRHRVTVAPSSRCSTSRTSTSPPRSAAASSYPPWPRTSASASSSGPTTAARLPGQKGCASAGNPSSRTTSRPRPSSASTPARAAGRSPGQWPCITRRFRGWRGEPAPMWAQGPGRSSIPCR